MEALKILEEYRRIIDILLVQNKRIVNLLGQFCNVEKEEGRLEEIRNMMEPAE